MLNYLKYGLYLFVLLSFTQSCVDNSYDIDDFNKNAEFKIPPVPIGDVDTFWIARLDPGIIPEGIEFPPAGISIYVEIVKEQCVENLFTEDILEKFFYEDAKDSVKLEAMVDVEIFNPHAGLEVDLITQVVDRDEMGRSMVSTNVKIPTQRVKYGKNQRLVLAFPNEQFRYMKNARDLKFTIVIKASNLFLLDNDYIFIKDVVLKSSGMHFKF